MTITVQTACGMRQNETNVANSVRRIPIISADKVGRVKSRASWQSPAETLVNRAKADPKARRACVETLLSGGPLFLETFKEPKLSDCELVALSRVASWMALVSSEAGHREAWHAILQDVIALVLRKQPPTARELREAAAALPMGARYWERDNSALKCELRKRRSGLSKSAPDADKRRPGRYCDARSQRIIAATHFLKRCGDKRPEETISECLYDLGQKLDADSIRRLVVRFKARAESNGKDSPLDRLLEVWLCLMASYLWASVTGATHPRS